MARSRVLIVLLFATEYFDLGFYLAIHYAKGERLASLFARLVTVGFKIAPHLLNHFRMNYSDFGSPRTLL